MLAGWQDDGVLDRDDEPALWLYELQPPGGAPATVGWLGAVALPPGGVGGGAAARGHLSRPPSRAAGRCWPRPRTDLEPIVLAHDPDPTVAELTGTAAPRRARRWSCTDSDGVGHRLWRVTDPAAAGPAHRRPSARTGAVIADGHHRFAAARANARTRAGAAPGSDAVLALVTPMGPGGLRVAPIHRVVPDLALDARARPPPAGLPGDRAAGRRAATCGRSSPPCAGWLGDAGESGFLRHATARRLVRADRPVRRRCSRAVPPEAPPAWRGLDVVLAHHGLLGRLWQRGDDPESVLIAHTRRGRRPTAADRGGVALLLRAPSPADVAAVARAGARMPRKSTLFVPKPRTGLVLRPLAD